LSFNNIRVNLVPEEVGFFGAKFGENFRDHDDYIG
jgi:hypothetical protein